MRRFLTVLPITADIPFSTELLGTKFEVKIKNATGNLIFPKVQSTVNLSQKLSHEIEEKYKNRFENTDWGSLKGDGQFFSLKKLAFDISFPSNEKEINRKQAVFPYEGDLRRWLNRFIYFLEIKMQTQYHFLYEQGQKHQATLCLDQSGNDLGLHSSTFLPIYFTIHNGINVCESDVTPCVNAVNKGLKPLPELSILREAVINFNETNFRSSVIESGTSIEICLTRLLRKIMLNKLSENETLSLLKKYHSLSGRISLAKVFDLSLDKWKNFKAIEKPRNEAVHAGKTPTPKEAKECLDMAKYFLSDNSNELSE
ncbi:MAG: hypothetical protein C0412_07490 [Flavobacterium sp.]|nr:hypothetical protein [Flavobacterium sp.]